MSNPVTTMPQRPAPNRALALCGVGYPLLTLVGFIAFPAADGGNSSPARDPHWLAAHTTAVLTQSYLRSAAALAFVVLAIVVGTAVARATHNAVLGPLAAVGGILSGALLLLAQSAVIAAAIGSIGGSPASQIGSFDLLNAALLSVSAPPAVIMFAVASVTWLRGRTVPVWLALLTLLGVPLGLVDAFDFAGGPLEALGLLGLAYFLVWGLASSITLAAGRHAPTAPLAEVSV